MPNKSNKLEGPFLINLRNKFNEIAGDDKLIDRNEFQEGLEIENENISNRLFDLFDLDKNGTIDSYEFLSSIEQIINGTEEQKNAWLPDLIRGRSKCCFGVTEPDSGLETGSIQTFARPDGDGYVITGQKIWTSTAQHADKIMLLARTTPKELCQRATDGLSLFFTDLDKRFVEVREIPKMGRSAVDSNLVFIDELPVPRKDLIGEEGRGFEYILHGLNPERILVGAEALGIGVQTLNRAVDYARNRVVFGRPIGQNQAIQHPLAENWMELQSAFLVCMEAARLYDAGKPAGALANAAKYLGAEAGYRAATQSVMTHGGMGYAKEYHVERLLREAMIPRLAPVSAQLILCYIAERVLDLPRSY